MHYRVIVLVFIMGTTPYLLTIFIGGYTGDENDKIYPLWYKLCVCVHVQLKLGIYLNFYLYPENWYVIRTHLVRICSYKMCKCVFHLDNLLLQRVTSVLAVRKISLLGRPHWEDLTVTKISLLQGPQYYKNLTARKTSLISLL